MSSRAPASRASASAASTPVRLPVASASGSSAPSSPAPASASDAAPCSRRHRLLRCRYPPHPRHRFRRRRRTRRAARRPPPRLDDRAVGVDRHRQGHGSDPGAGVAHRPRDVVRGDVDHRRDLVLLGRDDELMGKLALHVDRIDPGVPLEGPGERVRVDIEQRRSLGDVQQPVHILLGHVLASLDLDIGRSEQRGVDRHHAADACDERERDRDGDDEPEAPLARRRRTLRRRRGRRRGTGRGGMRPRGRGGSRTRKDGRHRGRGTRRALGRDVRVGLREGAVARRRGGTTPSGVPCARAAGARAEALRAVGFGATRFGLTCLGAAPAFAATV